MIREIVKGVWAFSRLASSNERQGRALLVPLYAIIKDGTIENTDREKNRGGESQVIPRPCL